MSLKGLLQPTVDLASHFGLRKEKKKKEEKAGEPSAGLCDEAETVLLGWLSSSKAPFLPPGSMPRLRTAGGKPQS